MSDVGTLLYFKWGQRVKRNDYWLKIYWWSGVTSPQLSQGKSVPVFIFRFCFIYFIHWFIFIYLMLKLTFLIQLKNLKKKNNGSPWKWIDLFQL
jgi:hypothetical protein